MIDSRFVFLCLLESLLLLLPILLVLVNIFDKLWHLVDWLTRAVECSFLIGIELLLCHFVGTMCVLYASLLLRLHVVRLFGSR